MEERLKEGWDIENRRRRRRRADEMRKRKKRQKLLRRWLKAAIPAAALVAAGIVIMAGRNAGKLSMAEVDTGSRQEEGAAEGKGMAESGGQEAGKGKEDAALTEETALTEDAAGQEEEEEKPDYWAEETPDTIHLGESVDSQYAVFIDTDSRSILAEKNARVRMNPASMTKVLTLLVAAEHIENLEDTFTITLEITDYSFVNGCSNAGFEKDETVTVRDLLYGTILPSGAEAAAGLAVYTAGSLEAFVGLMNEKLQELGLSESAHVTNCVGIYDADHYCTVYDMAVIMEAALDNALCREVLSARTYTTSATEEHPEGMILSNWFLRRIEDKETGGKVTGGKTGYVKQSGSCAVSCGIGQNGRNYICVTADAGNQWRCINDHAGLYKQFMDDSGAQSR